MKCDNCHEEGVELRPVMTEASANGFEYEVWCEQCRENDVKVCHTCDGLHVGKISSSVYRVIPSEKSDICPDCITEIMSYARLWTNTFLGGASR